MKFWKILEEACVNRERRGWAGGWRSMGPGRLGSRGGREIYSKSFLSDICICIHPHVHLFPIKIVVLIFKRKALRARCDEGRNCGHGTEGGRKGDSQEQSCQDSVIH